MERSHILLFDGECLFCNGAVRFIIKRDRDAEFKFAPLQSPIGQKLLNQYHISLDQNSIILIEQGKHYAKSAAALRVCRHLDGLWKVLYPLIIIPRPIRDFFYNVFSNNRYKWFGQTDSCPLPDSHVRKRFLS